MANSTRFQSTRTFLTFIGGFVALLFGIWYGHLVGDAGSEWAARRFAGWETTAQVLGFGATFLLVVLLGCGLGYGAAWIGSRFGLATGFDDEQDRKKAQKWGAQERRRRREADRSPAERRRVAERRRRLSKAAADRPR
jgi:hypothetical protein